MPPHIQPLSLRDLLVAKVAQMVFLSWVAIEGKYGHLDWSASKQKAVSDLQEFLLPYVGPIWNEVWHVAYKKYVMVVAGIDKRVDKLYRSSFRLLDLRIFSSMIIHDQMRILELPVPAFPMCGIRQPLPLSKRQMRQLKSIVILNIKCVRLTNTMLEIIGRTCKDLKEIHFTLCSRNATLDSLCHLLKCQELQIVEIQFEGGWTSKQYNSYILKFLNELPKLKSFPAFMSIADILPKLTSVCSLQHAHLDVLNANHLKNSIKMCPHVQSLHVRIVPGTLLDRQEVLTVLAECSLQLHTLRIVNVTYGKSMCRLLELKGKNLTKLELFEGAGVDITSDDIYTIGVNCPKLEELMIQDLHALSDSATNQIPVQTPEISVITTPAMFSDLRSLQLVLRRGWDIRVLLQVLYHANNLKVMYVCADVYPRGVLDILAEILRVNPPTELERLSIVMSGNIVLKTISRDSIEQLLVLCTKLIRLTLLVPLKQDAYLYLKELNTRVRNENLDLVVPYMCLIPDSYIEANGLGGLAAFY